MDMGHRIVEEKRLILISGDKVRRQPVQQVGHILLVLQFHLFAVQVVGLALGLGVPKNTAALEI